jgi:hypothetical protein
MRHAFCTTLVIIALSYPVLAQEQPSAAVPVEVVKAERKPIARAGDYVGRVEAISGRDSGAGAYAGALRMVASQHDRCARPCARTMQW